MGGDGLMPLQTPDSIAIVQGVLDARKDQRMHTEQDEADRSEALELADHPVRPWTPEGSLRTHPCGACGARSLAGCGFPDSCPIERS